MAVGAAPPPPLKTEVFGSLPNIELMTISPDGEKLAYIVVSGSQRRLIVKDLSGVEQYSSPLGDNKVRSLDWAGSAYILVSVSSAQLLFGEQNEFWQTLAVNLTTGKNFAVFGTAADIFHASFGYLGAVSTGNHWYGYFRGVTMSKSLGMAATFYAESYTDLYRVDLETGSHVIVARGQDRPRDWALDPTGAIVASSDYEETSGRWTLKAGPVGSKTLASVRSPLFETQLEGLGRTPGTILVSKPKPEEWSIADGSATPLPYEGVLQSYLHDPTTFRLIGLNIGGDRPEQTFFDPRIKARMVAISKALNVTPALISWSADARRMILYTRNDSDAGTYWLADGGSLKAYAYSYPEIPDANIGPVRMIAYAAADGLEIHGVLTLPPGREAKGLPLVVIPHGGPQAHDSLGFDWLAQAFANRGYAVFQPNFRGSDGYGAAFRDAGFGEWGRKMQTDISDGVAALAKQGVINPKRACIVGASYGGYAALAGVTVQQGLYRCAVSYGGISDLNYFMNTEAPTGRQETATARYLRKFLGVTSNEDGILRPLSPARLAKQADAPVLLMHGADDSVVAIGQSREMEQALRAAGKPVEFVTLKSEDHWLSRDATRKAFLTSAVGFVEKYNPAN
jgi:dipeptidyl aminopeptidase/acylaminoacyl peptidase